MAGFNKTNLGKFDCYAAAKQGNLRRVFGRICGSGRSSPVAASGVWWLLAIALALVFSFGAGCSRGKRNIRPYYFPALDLMEGKVYVYDLARADSSSPEYWYYRGFVRDSGIFLSATNYDNQFNIRQITREKHVESGVLMRDYFLYEPDTSTGALSRTQASLRSPSVFPFEVTDSQGVYLFHLSYVPDHLPEATIYVIRNRRYLGDGPLFDFNGRSYPTIRMGVRDAVGYDQEGSAEVEGTGEEWYAKGLGLVYWEKRFGRFGLERTYRLKEIISMEELERRSAQ
jgi:hypothetical protein